MSDGLILQALHQGCERSKNKNKKFTNGKFKQASVALIFRSSSEFHHRFDGQVCTLSDIQSLHDVQIEILFCQRSNSNRDVHSGQLCFPGGKVDNDEDDLQAVVRECREEIGIDFHTIDTLYIGRLPNNFDTRAQKRMRLCGHIFVICSRDSLQLNLSEIQDYKWIPIQAFNQGDTKLQLLPLSEFYAKHMILQMFLEYPRLADKISNQFDYGFTIMIDIGMKNYLFGFTLQLLCQMFNLILSQTQDRQQFRGFYEVVKSLFMYEIHFNNSTFLSWISNQWLSWYYRRYYIKDRIEVDQYLPKL